MVLLILIIKRGVLDPGGQQMLDMFIDQMSQLLVEQSQLEVIRSRLTSEGFRVKKPITFTCNTLLYYM